MKILNKILNLITILVFASGIYLNTSMLHIHRLADGMVVVHSHFYNKDVQGSPKHHHSPEQLSFISIMNISFISFLMAVFTIAFINKIIKEINFIQRKRNFVSNHLFCTSLRAPPALI